MINRFIDHRVGIVVGRFNCSGGLLLLFLLSLLLGDELFTIDAIVWSSPFKRLSLCCVLPLLLASFLLCVVATLVNLLIVVALLRPVTRVHGGLFVGDGSIPTGPIATRTTARRLLRCCLLVPIVAILVIRQALLSWLPIR